MDINDIYTPIEEAKEEIWKRWQDRDLEKKVDQYLKGNIPSVFLGEPKAISASHVATPNWAFFQFHENAKKIGLNPVAFEYLDDKFVTTNFDKAALGKMMFCHGKDQHGDMLMTNRHVIDLTGGEENKHINEIKTLWGENFVEFHHRILKTFCDNIEIYDGSLWYHAMGNNAREYYKYVVALYIRNGVLVENFLSTKSEGKFTSEVLLPAFELVYKEFGLKPLIVPIYDGSDDNHKYMWHYPEFVKMMLAAIITQPVHA